MSKRHSDAEKQGPDPRPRKAAASRALALVAPLPPSTSTRSTTPIDPVPVSRFHLTDTGNAEAFAARHGRNVRFDHRRQRWLLWRGHRWRPDTDAGIYRLAKSAMRERLRRAAAIDDPEQREKEARHALASESRSRIEAMLCLAQAEYPIADAGERWDVDPMVLCVPNGVINLRTGTLRSGKHEDGLTMSAGVPFDPQAPSPRWMRFLEELFNADQALISFVHRAVGYSLTGVTTEQCLFLCYGTGANGKTSLLQALRYALGDYALNTPFSTVELHQRAAIPNDLAALVNRRFVTASETNDGTRLNEARVKALSGCDPITARFLHAEFFTFQPVGKFWLSVNHRPIIRDDSHGFWRRIRLIPFTQRFAINPTLADELRAEAPGILAWAVRGCRDWQRDGLTPPPAVLAATREYERDSDQLAGFLEDACELQANAEVGATELFEHYKQWAERHGLSDSERLTVAMLGRKMTERFERGHTRAGKVYKGLARRVV